MRHLPIGSGVRKAPALRGTVRGDKRRETNQKLIVQPLETSKIEDMLIVGREDL